MTVRERTFDPLATALSAVENASRTPVDGNDLRLMLQTGVGDPSHLRALFGDVELHTLLRLAGLFAIDDRTLARSYAKARREVAAANSELDEFAAQFDL
jgi:hypothetical protein